MASNVTLEDVFEPLNDLDYPAAKEDVVRHAESRGASDDVPRAPRAITPAARSWLVPWTRWKAGSR